MARLVSIGLASVFLATPAVAQVANGNATSPWQVNYDEKSERSFDIIDQSGGGLSNPKGSMIIAGTELMPNAMVGFGVFGEKAERQEHARSINRDYSIPRTRKAAVGVALKF